MFGLVVPLVISLFEHKFIFLAILFYFDAVHGSETAA